MKFTDSNMSLVLARSLYIHENTEFSLHPSWQNLFLLLQQNFCVCDGKSIFAHFCGSGHMYSLPKTRNYLKLN